MTVLDLYEMSPKIYDEYISTSIEKKNFDEVFKAIKKIANGRKIAVLDLCCGTGIFPRKWLSKLRGIRYVGVDINGSFLKFARKNLKNKHYQFIKHDASTFSSKTRFDVVIATSPYHHIQDSRKIRFLRNIHKHLKKDGLFIVYEKMVAPFKNRVEAIDSGTVFYNERIKYMLKTEKLSETQIFALFNELYLTAIRRGEYKVPHEYFVKNLRQAGLKIIKEIKLWPKANVFNNKRVGDFVFVIRRV